jgi:hypothetical protein
VCLGWDKNSLNMGLVDTEEGIRFIRDVPPGSMIMEKIPNYFLLVEDVKNKCVFGLGQKFSQHGTYLSCNG